MDVKVENKKLFKRDRANLFLLRAIKFIVFSLIRFISFFLLIILLIQIQVKQHAFSFLVYFSRLIKAEQPSIAINNMPFIKIYLRNCFKRTAFIRLVPQNHSVVTYSATHICRAYNCDLLRGGDRM